MKRTVINETDYTTTSFIATILLVVLKWIKKNCFVGVKISTQRPVILRFPWFSLVGQQCLKYIQDKFLPNIF
jgi:hypothetical protein